MKSARRAAVLAIAFVLGAAARPAAAGIPDWAKAVAESAPAVEDGTPEWPARTLFASTSIVVSPDGSVWRVQRRKVCQFLSNRVADSTFESFQFNDTTKVKKSKGWHVPPGERAHRNVGGAIDLVLSSSFLTDAKERIVALDAVRRGSLVVYEFEAESRPYTLTNVQSFYDDVPVTLARWSIELPPGWTLAYAWLPGDGPAPTHTGNTWVVELHDLVPVRYEPMGDNPGDQAPRLVVALQPPSGMAPATPAFADWDAVGRWFQALADGRERASPEIQSSSKALLAKAGPAPLDRIRALSLFVRDRVRYVAREVGIGGYQPHPASQVFTELYGDCKDKGTLLRATLATSGFEAYPILIHASNPYTVAPKVPAPESFDHFIIGVVWPKGEAFPDEAAPARVDAGDAGTLLVVDPTDEGAWPGTLPDHLAGKTALVVAGARGVLLTLPDARPDWHRIARTETVTIAADRSVAIHRVSRLYGGPAEEARRASSTSFKDRRESIEDGIRDTWTGVQIKDYKVTPEDADGAYVETVDLTLPSGAAGLQEKAFWLFAGATGDIDRVPLGKRKTAVQYPYPFALSYDVTVTGAATTNPVPSPVKAEGAGWSVASTVNREGDVFHGVWTAQLATTRFEPAAFPDLKQFWSAASKAAAPGLYLSDQTPPPPR